MKKSKRVMGLVTLVSVVALGLPAISSAGVLDSGAENGKISVSYADLDLTQSSGVVTLYSRLKSAAKHACGTTSLIEAGSVQRVQQSKACYNSLLGRAVAKLENERLSAIHAG
jgi:UrcA family protein